jgi:hypothetical protein
MSIPDADQKNFIKVYSEFLNCLNNAELATYDYCKDKNGCTNTSEESIKEYIEWANSQLDQCNINVANLNSFPFAQAVHQYVTVSGAASDNSCEYLGIDASKDEIETCLKIKSESSIALVDSFLQAY